MTGTGQLLFTYTPFMHTLFSTRPVALLDGLLIVAIGVILLVVLETEKALMRRWSWLAQAADT